jgi:Raf kinase inhibitor-like YbhB/YbcL family protein
MDQRCRKRSGAAITGVVVALLLTGCSKGTTTASASASTAAQTAASCTPYDHLPKVASFTVTSNDVHDGQQMPKAQLSGIFGAGGSDTSPQLSWSGFPSGTKSFGVTMFDPDAPTGSGFWHWAVADIPAGVTSLPPGAGADNSTTLPAGALQLPNDARMARYVGAAPPAGSGTHRYFITVYALDVPQITIDKGATPAFLGSAMAGHTLARASMVPVAGS